MTFRESLLCLALLTLGSCGPNNQPAEKTEEAVTGSTLQGAAATPPPPAPEAEVISYRNDLRSGSMQFHVSTAGEGTVRSLAIQVERNGQEPIRIDEVIEGKVENSVISDLNSNKKPELLVFVSSGGSGSIGKVYGYEFDSQYWGELQLPSLTKAQQEGYMGHDTFKVNDGLLYRTFPVYLDADFNCCPSGGTRTIVYHLNSALTFSVERVE